MLKSFAFNGAGQGVLTVVIPHDYVDDAGNFKGGYGVLLDAVITRVDDDNLSTDEGPTTRRDQEDKKDLRA